MQRLSLKEGQASLERPARVEQIPCSVGVFFLTFFGEALWRKNRDILSSRFVLGFGLLVDKTHMADQRHRTFVIKICNTFVFENSCSDSNLSQLMEQRLDTSPDNGILSLNKRNAKYAV